MSEQLRGGEVPAQNTVELEQLAVERLKKLAQNGEQPENKEAAVEAARESLRKVETAAKVTETAPTQEPAAPPQGILSKAANYRHTMISLRHRMKPAARSFSQFIHRPTVEVASEALGKTVLRPSISLGATTTAVLFVGFIYFYARHYGFILRGSEVWIALLFGAAAGLLLEGLVKLVRRRSPR